MFALTTVVVFFSCISLLNLVLFVGLVRRLRADSAGNGLSGAGGAGLTGLPPGASAPDFGIDSLAGRRQLIGIFSTDCKACPDYLPRFRARAATFDGAAVAVLGGTAAKHDTYREQLGPHVVVIADVGTGPMASGSLTAAFGVTMWPSFFAIGPDGLVTASGPDGVGLPAPVAA